MTYEDIIYEKEDQIAIITLNRPERLNAYTRKMVREVVAALDDAAEDNDIRVLIITAAGRGFCSGVAWQDPEGGRAGVRAIVRHEMRLYPAITRLWDYDKPVICAVNGMTAGAGTSLAMVCDIRIASAQAKFCMVWARRGIVPDNGASYFLVRLVGLTKAYELTWTGDIIDAMEMERIGLVSKVVPHENLMKAAKEFAIRLAKGPPIAIQLSKRLLRRALIETDLAQQMELESSLQRIASPTEDSKEGSQALREKREPVFKGK